MTLRDVAEPLLRSFEERGCERLAAPDAPVTHGLLAPAVFFSVLGPEPWRSVHLQPVRRPQDARPRLHPHRLAVHHQVYAVLGSDLVSPFDLLLDVLAALRLEAAEHDLQLRARDCAIALAGVEASGWAMSVDGIEVGRACWVARVGGLAIAEPFLEVALGLERCAVVAGAGRGGGAVDAASRRLRAREEEELATYRLEAVAGERLATRLETLLAESEAALDVGLPLIAHRGLLEAAQVVQLLQPTASGMGGLAEAERRIAAGFGRCAVLGAERLSGATERGAEG